MRLFPYIGRLFPAQISSVDCGGSITFNEESSHPLKFNFKGPVCCTMNMSVPSLVRYLSKWDCRWTKFPDGEVLRFWYLTNLGTVVWYSMIDCSLDMINGFSFKGQLRAMKSHLIHSTAVLRGKGQECTWVDDQGSILYYGKTSHPFKSWFEGKGSRMYMGWWSRVNFVQWRVISSIQIPFWG